MLQTIGGYSKVKIESSGVNPGTGNSGAIRHWVTTSGTTRLRFSLEFNGQLLAEQHGLVGLPIVDVAMISLHSK